jgi:hypothetical protein
MSDVTWPATWQGAIDEGLAARLTRPLVRPGVLTAEPGARIIARMQQMNTGLPLMATIARHMPESDNSIRAPVVYGRPATAASPADEAPPVAPALVQRAPVVYGQPAIAAPPADGAASVAPVLAQRAPVVYGRPAIAALPDGLPLPVAAAVRPDSGAPMAAYSVQRVAVPIGDEALLSLRNAGLASVEGQINAVKATTTPVPGPSQEVIQADLSPAIKVTLPAGRRVQRSAAGSTERLLHSARGSTSDAGSGTERLPVYDEGSTGAVVPEAHSSQPRTSGTHQALRLQRAATAAGDSALLSGHGEGVSASEHKIDLSVRPVVRSHSLPAALVQRAPQAGLAGVGGAARWAPPVAISLGAKPSVAEAHYPGGLADTAGPPPIIRRMPDEAPSQAAAPAAAAPELNVAQMTEQIYALLVRRLADERERRGW